MKNIFKKILINLLVILITAQLIKAVSWGGDLKILILAATVLALVNAFIKPFLKILFLPLNVITLGLFGWLINVVILYLTTVLVPGFSLHPFTLQLLNTTVNFQIISTYIFVSFFFSLIGSIVSWLIY